MFPLPELKQANIKTDLTIYLRKVDPLLAKAIASGKHYPLIPGETYLFYENIGIFLVRNGCEIIVDPFDTVEYWALRLILLGRVMAVLLHQRGQLVLHGSAVAMGGEVIAFLGDTGSGKSTIAAAMHIRGHDVLADDIVSVEFDAFNTKVSGYPMLKLSPNAALSLGYRLQTMILIDPEEKKYGYYAKPDFPNDRLPLGRIYLICDGIANKIEPLMPKDSFIELIRNTYTVGLLKAYGASSHFNQCARLAGTIPIRRLKRFKDLKMLPQIGQLIEEDVANENDNR